MSNTIRLAKPMPAWRRGATARRVAAFTAFMHNEQRRARVMRVWAKLESAFHNGKLYEVGPE